MEVYLIRHTTPDIAKGICYGQADLSLTSSFEEEADEILKKLPHPLDIVYTSPLKRCQQLAKRIPHKTLEEVPQLQEMNFGDWELKPWSHIPEAALNPWMEDFVNVQVPNGESMKMLADRVISWYDQIMAKNSKGIAIVTHAGPIRVLLSHVNQTPLGEAFQRYNVQYGEVIPISETES